MSNILNIGKSGVNAARSNLKTTSHNIANANTEGYSRQRVQQQANAPINRGGLNEGSGTRVKAINRVHDEFVEKRLNSTISQHNFYQERAHQLKQVENIFNEIDSDGLNKVLNKFYNSFRELSNQPENETLRSVVRDNAGLVANDFKRIRSNLDEAAKNIDLRIHTEVEDINAILRNISRLNRQISNLEAGREQTGDLRDQRDLQIRELSKSFTVTTYRDDRNNYIVSAEGVGTLITGGHHQELQAGGVPKDASGNNMDGSIEVFFKNRPNSPITPKFEQGKLASMLNVRNNDIRQLQERVDNVAYDFANSVNAVHRRGYANRQVEVDPNTNQAPSFDSRGATTGINFFETPQQRDGAANNLSLSAEVNQDLSNIATALNPNSPGDNRIAIAISKLQHERIMDGGTSTLEEYYLQTIGNVGVEAGKATFDAEQASGIYTQAKSMRERISGVSIDEEAAEMIRHQHAFQASAKVIQAADEMFQTLLGLKR